MKKKIAPKFIVLISILIVASYFGAQRIIFSLTHESTDNAQVETQIVPVLARVSGYVKSLNIKDYDSVSKGELLAQLDDAELQTQLLEAEADLQQALSDESSAKAAIESTRAAINVSKGALELNKVKQQKAESDAVRDNRLMSEGALTKKAAEESQFNLDLARQSYMNSKAELSLAESKMSSANAALQRANDVIKIKQARIEQLKLKLTYTKIVAPITGRIGRRNVAEGQLLQIGTPLFSIVNDSAFWVVANFKESQLSNLPPGKTVQLRLDAFPDLKITGTVQNISEATGAKFALIPPDNASGNFVKVTQRIPIKIKIDNLDEVRSYLRAGMSVFVTAKKN